MGRWAHTGGDHTNLISLKPNLPPAKHDISSQPGAMFGGLAAKIFISPPIERMERPARFGF